MIAKILARVRVMIIPMNKLISVIIPVYNGAKYIKETIEGIKAQNMNVEIIVVDDVSPDNSGQIAKELGCRVIRHTQNTGQVIGKNTGIREAKGEYIVFNDQDDIMRENTLQTLYDEMEKNPEISAVMAKSLDFVSPDAKNQNMGRKEAVWGMYSGATMFRKSMFDIIGLFDETVRLNTGETIIIQNKMKEHNLIMKKIDFIATNRRIHDNNFGVTNQSKEYKDYATVLSAKLSRK